MGKPRKTVLIVDDDTIVRETVRLALQEQDFVDIVVVESADVPSGITQLKKTKPDIVILDLHLPGKSGFDFMDIMNKDKLLANTRVIMLTVDDTMKNVFTAADKGIDMYYFLGKPYNVSDLQAMVLEICLNKNT
jgi:DNA-binding response OmpR family regulator